MMKSNTQGHGTIKKLRTGAVVSTLALTALGVSTGVSASETEVAVNESATRVKLMLTRLRLNLIRLIRM